MSEKELQYIDGIWLCWYRPKITFIWLYDSNCQLFWYWELNYFSHLGVSFKNRRVDEMQGLLLREGDVENTKKRDESRVHFIPTAPSLSHGCNEAQVLYEFIVKFLSSVIHASLVQQQLQESYRLLSAIFIHLRWDQTNVNPRWAVRSKCRVRYDLWYKSILTLGMLRSSINTRSLLPIGGPYVSLVLFSTLASRVLCRSIDVVLDEKLMIIII